MTHLSDRAILELRDGVPLDADARSHAEACERCAEALRNAEAREREISTELEHLDRPFDVEAARDAVRSRLGTGQSSEGTPDDAHARVRPLRSLGRAAAVVLIAAGAVSAMPGSPVRTWLGNRQAEQPAASEETAVSPAEPVGMRLNVGDGPVEIVLVEVPSGTEIELQWVEGSAVTVRAAPGSAFSSATGRVLAEISAGPVTIQLPRSVGEASLTVNQRMYLQVSAGTLDVETPAEEQDDDRIRFIVP